MICRGRSQTCLRTTAPPDNDSRMPTIAANGIDVYYERGIKPWDYGAGALIVEEAGGRVLPLSGGCDVTCDDERLTLTGRRSVFSRVTCERSSSSSLWRAMSSKLRRN